MSETVDETSPQLAATMGSEAGATKSALKTTNAVRARRSSARKVVISDNPMNQTGKSGNGTMRSMG